MVEARKKPKKEPKKLVWSLLQSAQKDKIIPPTRHLQANETHRKVCYKSQPSRIKREQNAIFAPF